MIMACMKIRHFEGHNKFFLSQFILVCISTLTIVLLNAALFTDEPVRSYKSIEILLEHT